MTQSECSYMEAKKVPDRATWKHHHRCRWIQVPNLSHVKMISCGNWSLCDILVLTSWVKKQFGSFWGVYQILLLKFPDFPMFPVKISMKFLDHHGITKCCFTSETTHKAKQFPQSRKSAILLTLSVWSILCLCSVPTLLYADVFSTARNTRRKAHPTPCTTHCNDAEN